MVKYFYTNNESEYYLNVRATDLIHVSDGKFKDYDLYIPDSNTHPHLDKDFLSLVVSIMEAEREDIINRVKYLLGVGFKYIIVRDDGLYRFEVGD